MKRITAASTLSALLFVQGLLGFAALASVLLERFSPPAVVVVAQVPTDTALR